MAKALRLNERIRVTPVRVINQHQEQIGVIATSEALALARDAGLDLVEVSPNEKPPVCRIVDYGRAQYEKKKRLKQGAGAHQIIVKEIRIRPKTDTHDRAIKMDRAKRFLSEGNKVQFTMLFRGRERFHRERAQGIFDELLTELGETIKLERRAAMDGRRMTMLVAPAKRTARPSVKKQVSGTSKRQVRPKDPRAEDSPADSSPAAPAVDAPSPSESTSVVEAVPPETVPPETVPPETVSPEAVSATAPVPTTSASAPSAPGDGPKQS